MSLIGIPCTSVKSNYVALYTRFEGVNRRRRNKMQKLLTAQQAYDSSKEEEALSRKASARLRAVITTLSVIAKRKRVYSAEQDCFFSFRLNFITLTLPSKQIHGDKEIHSRIFCEFIRAWKRKAKDLLYVWKAETQQNGNLHYHLITDTYIHHLQLRRMWNFYCEKLKYCTRSSSKDPNSTDVHAVKNIKNIAAYAIKYMCKKAEGRRVPDIRKWYCSKALLLPVERLEGSTAASNKDIGTLINEGGRVWQNDFCTCIFFTREQIAKTKIFSKVLLKHFERIRQYNRNQTE